MRATGFGIIGVALLLAACGSTNEQQAASGGATGAVAGALVGGPVGAVVGGAVGAAGGTAMPKGADQYAEQGLDKVKEEAGTSHHTTKASGTSTAAGPRLSTVDVRNRLRDDGWVDVSNVSRWGNDSYTANAQKNGVKYRLEVDGNTGRVVDQRRI